MVSREGVMNKPTTLLDQHGKPANLDSLAGRIFHIANVLDVLGRVLPDDLQDAPPVRCLVQDLAETAMNTAIEVSELYFDAGAIHG